jgi:hypothetical protein
MFMDKISLAGPDRYDRRSFGPILFSHLDFSEGS